MIRLTPRFSMRWLLLGFTVATIAFYILFIRRTIVAERFARAVESGDLKHATSMLIDDNIQSPVLPKIPFNGGTTSSTAQILPRTWRDIWHLRRIVSVRTAVRISPDGQQTESYSYLIYQDNNLFQAGTFHLRCIEKTGGYVW